MNYRESKFCAYVVTGCMNNGTVLTLLYLTHVFSVLLPASDRFKIVLIMQMIMLIDSFHYNMASYCCVWRRQLLMESSCEYIK
jgi:hypothetical protein